MVLKEIPDFMEIAAIQDELEKRSLEISSIVGTYRKQNDEEIYMLLVLV